MLITQSVSIALAPQVFWEPLTHQQKGRINSWLVQGNELIYPPSNWRCECFCQLYLCLSVR